MNIGKSLVLAALAVAAAAALVLASARTSAESAQSSETETPGAVHETMNAASGSSTAPADGGRRLARVVSLTMVSTTRHVAADGRQQLISSSTLLRLSDGSFSQKTVHYGEDGSEREAEHHVAEAGRAVFRVDERRRLLILTAPMPEGLNLSTEEALRSGSLFVREDSVLGHNTLVLRYAAGPDENSYIERYYAPDLQCIVKEVSASPHGMLVTEATEITPGEPDRSTFAPLSAYRIDASDFEQKLRGIEQAEGDSATARELRGRLMRATRGRQ